MSVTKIRNVLVLVLTPRLCPLSPSPRLPVCVTVFESDGVVLQHLHVVWMISSVVSGDFLFVFTKRVSQKETQHQMLRSYPMFNGIIFISFSTASPG